jgi:hypothetical protein
MKRLIWTIGLLSTFPLMSQSFEAAVFAGRQTYNDFRKDSIFGMPVEAAPESKTVVALRFGYSVADLGPGAFQLNLGIQPESSTKTDVKLGGAFFGTGEIKQSYWSFGFAFNSKTPIAVGLGVDYRSEKLSDGATDTTYGRPWIRGNVGYVFPGVQLRPFLSFEIAVPLASTNNDVASPEAVLKSLAPKSQVGLYAGIRF